MSIRETRTIDWLGIEKDTGNILLTVIDDEDWADEANHLELLQEKLNSYLAFIESGEVYQRLASELGLDVAQTVPVKLNILARYPVPPTAEEFLTYAQRMFTGAGFSLSHEVLAIRDHKDD